MTLPVAVVRAEDFPGQVDLAVAAQSPLQAAPDVATLVGQDQTASTITVSAPPGTRSGRYSIAVTASDGTRQRTSVAVVTVDADLPVARPPAMAIATGGRLDSGSFRALASWPAATDATSAIAGYQAQWRVDGGAWGATISLGATTRQAAVTMAGGHAYTVRLRARDAAGNWGAWVVTGPVRAGVIEETGGLSRTGTWRTYRSSLMSGGSSIYSSTARSSVLRSFTGRSVALVAPRGPGRGLASIWVDGAKVATIDLRSSTLSPRVIVFARSWPGAGRHSIRIVVAGTPGRPRVDVDALIVVG